MGGFLQGRILCPPFLRVAWRFVDDVDAMDDVDNLAVSPGMTKGSGEAPFLCSTIVGAGVKPAPTM